MTRQARTPPTTESLVANSRHLFYEIAMFGQTTRLLRTTPWADELPLDDKIRLLALIESRLIHARSLMGFLFPQQPLGRMIFALLTTSQMQRCFPPGGSRSRAT